MPEIDIPEDGPITIGGTTTSTSTATLLPPPPARGGTGGGGFGPGLFPIEEEVVRREVDPAEVIIEYNEENALDAIAQIETFDADFGGTFISGPMDEAINLVDDANLRKRIILLSDGQVDIQDKNRTIELAGSDQAITHTIGIGSGADADLLERTADAGRGSFSLI